MISPKAILYGIAALAFASGITAIYISHKAAVSAAYKQGATDERQASEQRAKNLIKQMEQDGAELNAMDRDRLICELSGGLWNNSACN